MLLTISNLYPRPDQPQRGLFNRQLFEAMAEVEESKVEGRRSQGAEGEAEGSGKRAEEGASVQGSGVKPGATNLVSGFHVQNICLVPEWRVWRWPEIRKWRESQKSKVSTVYLPVFYLPLAGRSLSAWTYGWTLREMKTAAGKCDAVFSAWLYPDGVAATALAGTCGKPSWILVQGSDTFHLRNPGRRAAILDACGRAQGIVCVWKGLAERLIAAGVAPEKIHVVPNGVDAEVFRFRSREEAWAGIVERQKSQACCPNGDPSTSLRFARDDRRPPVMPSLSRHLAGGVTTERIDLGNKLSPVGSKKRDDSSLLTHHPVKVVLFVGNLVPEKGPDALVEAWGELRKAEGGDLKAECGTEEGEEGKAEGGDLRPEYGENKAEGEALQGGAFGVKHLSRLAGRGERLAEECLSDAEFRSQVSSFILLFIGDGPMREDLEQRVKRMGVEDSVVFLGARPHEEVALWMNRADCLCVPSRSEGMPNVVIEALASGLPVVATDAGAIPELLAEEPAAKVTGVAGLAGAIRDMLAQPVDREAMARRQAGRFSWRRTAATIRGLILGEGDKTIR